MDYQNTAKSDSLIGFLRHRDHQKYQREALGFPLIDIFVGHQAIPGRLLLSRAYFRFTCSCKGEKRTVTWSYSLKKNSLIFVHYSDF